MPSERSSWNALARRLGATERPVYVLDANRKLVYANAACAAWLGIEVESLLGLACTYHTPAGEASSTSLASAAQESKVAQQLAALAGAICPSPEAWTSPSTESLISIIDANGVPRSRRAMFVGLSIATASSFTVSSGTASNGTASTESAGVLAILDAADCDPNTSASAAELASSPSASLHARLQVLRAADRLRYDVRSLVGTSVAARRIRAQAELAIESSADVLIAGRAGSGREHLARTIHAARQMRKSTGRPSSEPSDASLFVIQCRDATSDVVLETLRAATTTLRGISARRGSARDQPAAARGSVTLLLLNLDELPAEIEPVLAGWLAKEPSARILATATASIADWPTSLHEEIAARLGTLTISIPPLADRLEDLPLLAQFLLEEINGRGGKQISSLSSDALEALAAHAWPREMDELVQAIEAAHANASGVLVTAADFPAGVRFARDAARLPPRVDEAIDLGKFLEEIERELIERALARAKGNKTKGARLLGLNRPRLYRRMVQLGLISPDEPETDATNEPSESSEPSELSESREPSEAGPTSDRASADLSQAPTFENLDDKIERFTDS